MIVIQCAHNSPISSMLTCHVSAAKALRKAIDTSSAMKKLNATIAEQLKTGELDTDTLTTWRDQVASLHADLPTKCGFKTVWNLDFRLADLRGHIDACIDDEKIAAEGDHIDTLKKLLSKATKQAERTDFTIRYIIMDDGDEREEVDTDDEEATRIPSDE